ncbi:Casein kinase I isoform delta [Cladobotryum mycophilum]|uniref:non-specific serine/threonine protein kinase n=1 Tax=Cladobotryum mycophilum TaxID=491253 RepID=A0ABR0SNG3_9HYPO
MKDIIINKRYRVDRKIGEGGYGLVYSGVDMKSKQEVAIKLMLLKRGPTVLQNEFDMCQALAGGIGIPQALWLGQQDNYHVLVCDLLGPSLEDLFNYCDRRFSLKTILLIVDQVLSRLEYIHSKGILHCDVKPDNFLMGVGRMGNTIYAIDFGVAIKANAQGEKLRRDFVGTRQFASMNTHEGWFPSWRDDLESLGYMLVYFADGSLPWDILPSVGYGRSNEKMLDEKDNRPPHFLCSHLHKEFRVYLEYAQELKFKTKPDYEYLRTLFRNLFTSQGFKYDNVFDWTEKLYHEMRSTTDESKATAP